MNKKLVEQFKNYFAHMNLNNDSVLEELYSEDIVFIDPIHEIQGIKPLIQYFNKLNDNLIEGSFLFKEESIFDDKAYLVWEMNLKLKKPSKIVQASGISVLTMNEGRITKQRDYFDAGELFYEHIPILGSIIRSIKKKIGTN